MIPDLFVYILFLIVSFVSLEIKKGGGLSFNSTVPLTQCSEKLVQLILHEYSILLSGHIIKML